MRRGQYLGLKRNNIAIALNKRATLDLLPNQQTLLCVPPLDISLFKPVASILTTAMPRQAATEILRGAPCRTSSHGILRRCRTYLATLRRMVTTARATMKLEQNSARNSRSTSITRLSALGH